MKLIVIIQMLCLTILSYGQTYLVDQHFSNVAPTGWSSTSNVWNFARNESATGNYRNVFDATTYSARFSSASNGNSIYIYIPINFITDNTYTITFYTKRACSITVNTNELPNQTTLLTTDTQTNPNCSSNWNTWYQWSFTVVPNYNGSGYFQIWVKAVYGGPTSVYLDDLSIYESPPISLPIELLYFKGKQTEEGNLLEWATATETNNHYFTIYKTYYPINWREVAKVDGVGTSSFTHYYRYIETDYFNDISYYYLSQTDYDGKSKDFEIISIDNRKIIPQLIKITNILGQEIDSDSPGIKFFHYSDGTIIKRL
jgi:hypothetical protein